MITTKTVKAIRDLIAAGISQKQVATMLGISKGTVSKYRSDEAQKAYVAYQRARWQEEKGNLEIVERRRTMARERARRLKCEGR